MNRGRWNVLQSALAVGMMGLALTSGVIAGLALGRAAQAEDRAPTYEQRLEWALHLMEQGRYADASDAIGTLVAAKPTAAAPYQLRAVLGLYIGRPAQAESDLHQADTLTAGDPATQYGLALCALMNHRTHDAESLLAGLRQSQHLTDAQMADVDTAIAYIQYIRGDVAGARATAERRMAPSDRTRQELLALMADRRDPSQGVKLLADFLHRSNGLPGVSEANGIRALFDVEPSVEPSVLEPEMQQMYAVRLAGRAAGGAAKETGVPRIAGFYTLTAPTHTEGEPAFVTFFIDGRMAAMVNTAPYRYEWNTNEAANGLHTVRVEASDAAGNVLASHSYAARVFNKDSTVQADTGGEANPLVPESIQTRLWDLLRLRPSRKVAEWRLGEDAARRGDQSAASAHFTIAAALDPDYKDGRRIARETARRALMRPARTGSQVVLWTGNSGRREIALTFDDGPSVLYTPALLSALDKVKAPATFFVVGSRAETAPDLVRQMVARGDDVENHSYTHQNMTQMPHTQAECELLRANLIIQALTGRTPQFFRPPGGDRDASVLGLSSIYGMTTALWTVDVFRAEEEGSVEGLVSYVLKHVRPGAIILLHNGTAVTTESVPQLVVALRKQGYHLVTLRQMVANTPSLAANPSAKLRE